MKNWIVKAFHTGGPYQKDAVKLRTSLEKYDIPFHIEGITSRGSWNKNTHYKPQSVLNAMDEYPGIEYVIHVDIDSWFMQYPSLFDELDCDIGAFYFGSKKTWCSGTIIFRNSVRMSNFVDLWDSELSQNPKQHGDQVAMGGLIDLAEDLNVLKIPAGYLQGLSKHLQKGEGVIAHDGARKRYVGTKIYNEPK